MRYLSDLQEAGCVEHPVLKRQLEKLTLLYRTYQIDPNLSRQIIDLDSAHQGQNIETLSRRYCAGVGNYGRLGDDETRTCA